MCGTFGAQAERDFRAGEQKAYITMLRCAHFMSDIYLGLTVAGVQAAEGMSRLCVG